MSNRRYHIHIICADNDQSLVLDSLAIFFQSRAFLTYDVSSNLPTASLYGRQCIDACDYALMVIGDSYGAVQKTGVSQMHLSYLNAKAKLKPLLIIVKNHYQETGISRQLQELVKAVSRQNNQIHYYDTEDDIEPLLVQAYYDMLANNTVAGGWVRASEEMIEFGNQTIAERFADILSKNKNIDKEDTVDEEPVIETVNEPLSLTDTFHFQYRAQAYEGGNLKDVSREMALSWQEILIALMNIPLTFSSYGLKNTINRLIALQAEVDIKREMPNVHAVSRCQIAQDDLNRLQRQLVAANWIQLTTYGTRLSQELWKLTFYAKKLLEQEPSEPNE